MCRSSPFAGKRRNRRRARCPSSYHAGPSFARRRMARIFLTQPGVVRRLYHGDKALAGLRALGDVLINDSGRELTTPELIDAATGCEIIVS